MSVCYWETNTRNQLQQSSFSLVVFSALSKFYEKMNKRLSKKSENLISAQLIPIITVLLSRSISRYSSDFIREYSRREWGEK